MHDLFKLLDDFSVIIELLIHAAVLQFFLALYESVYLEILE